MSNILLVMYLIDKNTNFGLLDYGELDHRPDDAYNRACYNEDTRVRNRSARRHDQVEEFWLSEVRE